MFNLLPIEEKKNIRNEYRLRLFSMTLFLLAFSLSVCSIFLITIHFISLSELRSFNLSSNEEEGNVFNSLKEELGKTNRQAEMILKWRGVRAYDIVSSAISSTKGIDVQITDIIFENTEEEKALVMRGVASGREDLKSLIDRFESHSIFQKAEVPVSDFAKDKNVDFRLSLKWNEQKQ